MQPKKRPRRFQMTDKKKRTPRGVAQQFAEEVAAQKREAQECIIWPFRRDRHGYGRMGRSVLAHRAICSMAHGEPERAKLEARHTCGNGHLGCVSPAHLCWGTHDENMKDAVAHGNSLKGERHPRSRLTEEAVREIRRMLHAESVKVISERFGVSTSAIRLIQWGRRWQHVR